jgi:hypothetical protein
MGSEPIDFPPRLMAMFLLRRLLRGQRSALSETEPGWPQERKRTASGVYHRRLFFYWSSDALLFVVRLGFILSG